jgi:transcriptional regulator with XRE-family HTH domain
MLSPDDLPKAVGAALKQMREQKGLTQEAVAEKAGVHITWVTQMERGYRNPTIISVAKIAAALETSLVDVFALAEEIGEKD